MKTAITLENLYDLEDEYAHVQIDTEDAFSSVPRFMEYLEFYNMTYLRYFVSEPDFDFQPLRELSRKYPLPEWREFAKYDTSNYREVRAKLEAIPYSEQYQHILTLDNELRSRPRFWVSVLIEECQRLYLISGKTEWHKEVKTFDLRAIYESYLEACIKLDRTIAEKFEGDFLGTYWERLKKDSPLSLDRHYAAMTAGKKEDGDWILENWENREAMLPLRPAAGFLFYFDSETERDTYVAANPEYVQALNVDELSDLQWPCTNAVKPDETFAKVGQPLATYAVFMGDKLFGVYETLEQAEALKELMPTKGIKIMKSPTPQANLNTLAKFI